MKVIDLLAKIANGEEVPKKIKYNDDLYTHVDNYCYCCEETNEILSQNIYAEFSRLNDEIEIIEEPKEELEEIELIGIHYVNDKCIFKVNGQSVDETIAIKVNELIENQNKIIRKLKVNKKQ